MQIAVMGCGWLGLPLAQALLESGHNVVATRRSETGVAELSALGINGIQFELTANLSASTFDCIFNSDVLFLNIPVGRKSVHKAGFLHGIEALLKRAKLSNIQHVLFVSTTSVYGSGNGKVTELSPTHPETQSAKVNLVIEQLVKQYFVGQASIIRLAGLVGGTRHPVKFLAGKTALMHPQQVVNLVHLQDVLNAVQAIMTKSMWGETFLLSSTEHPTRQQYYTWAANQLGLTEPEFIDEGSQPEGKIIDPSQTLARLGLKLQYPSPFQML